MQLDTLGKEMLQKSDCARTMFKYKDCVNIPVLTFVDDALSVTDCGPNSVKMNAYVQSKVDTKRLELGQSKCFKMHIGKKQCSCENLKVHGQQMLTSTQEKYLGDIITSSAKIDENIKMRYDKGIGIANQILSMLKEVSFGVYHFEMGLLFRTSQLINGIMFNTEALFGMTNKHIELLEECDKYLLRSLFNAHFATPIEALFIETSTIPLRFVLQGRRIMYYWTILKKPKTELVKRVFLALKEFPVKDDWLQQVKADLVDCDIILTETQIRSMSRYSFKSLVDKKIKERASSYLIGLQMKHSKSQYLHQNPAMKSYLTSDKISTRQKQLLFKLRTGTTPNKTNFRNQFKNNLSCILCQDPHSEESLSHLLRCTYIENIPELSESTKIQCEDIYGPLESQITAVKVWEKIFKIYAHHSEKN